MKEEDQEWICQSCWLEFSLSDEGVQIVSPPKSKRCLIVVNGLAHSLVRVKDWKRILRDRDDEDHARALNKYLDDEDIPAEDSLVTALEDIAGIDQIASGEAQ